ncbi:hypothetical protein LRAMOSA08978 [Lichtheimia ramosa]|uniref:F-box domain-containing protein n=1 Tax=Lichtheimia ramosa TaxID=688394 RepID=A0A077WGC9_9FUNG|nr:hypothetical protein LRAMOSA08978 [Lichtheimia ramosa]
MPKQPLSDSTQSSRQGVFSTRRRLLPPASAMRRHGAEILRLKRATKRVDFVSQLPFELVSSLILPDVLCLPYGHAFLYLHVCRTWRQRVLQSQLHYQNFGKLTQGGMNIMLAYAPYLHKIRIGSPTPFPVNFFARAQFTSLQSLRLFVCFENDMHALYPLLTPIAYTLKELYLLVNRSTLHMEICLNEILQRCTNIEIFSCNKVNVTDLIAHPQHIHKVKKLVLTTITQPLGSQDVIDLLKRFPSLEHLVLTDCQDSSPLATLHQYCPALGSLSYMMTGQTRSLALDAPVMNISGFHSLSIGAGDSFNIQHLIPLLTAHCDTLVDIHIHGKMNQQSNMTNAVLPQDVVFKQLRKFTFDPNQVNDGKTLIQWILKRVPNARKIHVINCNVDGQHVYEALKQAKNLKSLTFTLPSPSLIHLLEYHGTLGHQSTLHSVNMNVDFSREHRALAFKAVVRLSNLRTLYFELQVAALGEEFVAFIENMALGCPFLEEVIMLALTEFPSAIIAKFPLCLKLRQLTLGGLNVWYECLLQLLKCPSLKDLFIDRENIQDHVAAKLDHLIREDE